MSIVNRIRDMIPFRRKANLSLSPPIDRGWNIIYESRPLAFQQDVTLSVDHLLKHPTVYACITLIASDLGKMCLLLKEKQDSGIWLETDSPSFSPVIRKPNGFQTRQQFIETWVMSKLINGNTYALKARDNRGIVTALYILDPHRVTPLISTDGSVFYRLNSDDLSQLPFDVDAIPASEMIHDRMECLFHPIVGISPLFACGLAATQGIKIINNSANFFANMSRPSGILTAPGQISDDTAKRLKEHWEKNYRSDNMGKVAVLGDDLKYTAMSQTAVDSQLVDQLKLSDEKICSTFHVPAYMVGVGPTPPYNNIEALSQQYYSQCLQKFIEAIEACLDEGLGLPYTGRELRTEFELDDLLRMDSATRIKSINESVAGGWLAPDEARAEFDLAPVPGGKSPYLQQQNYSLAALAKRDELPNPFVIDRPTPNPTPSADGPAPAADPNKSVEAIIVKMGEMIDAANSVLTASAKAVEEAKSVQVNKSMDQDEELIDGLLILSKRLDAEPACVA